MPKVSRESATQGGDYGVVVDRADEVEGYSINFTTFREDIDATPLMKGLPDDRCQCPHWGYVIAGKVTFRFEDREELVSEPRFEAEKLRRLPRADPAFERGLGHHGRSSSSP